MSNYRDEDINLSITLTEPSISPHLKTKQKEKKVLCKDIILKSVGIVYIIKFMTESLKHKRIWTLMKLLFL